VWLLLALPLGLPLAYLSFMYAAMLISLHKHNLVNEMGGTW